MKQTDLIVLALAGVAVYMIVTSGKKGSAGSGLNAFGVYDFAGKTTFELQGGKAKNGWQYFDDGTALDPDGNAWQGGQIITTGKSAPQDKRFWI